MCGIAGFFSTGMSDGLSRTTLDAMLEQISSRGPDARHITAWDVNGARLAGDAMASTSIARALIHARLAIIDPASRADQPMSSDDGKIWICYNGEVYDWEADAATLRSAGHRFRTHSDTEFILRAYETWGLEKTLACLRGMYAFAIYDARRSKVFLARDPMGKKPLLYHVGLGNDATLSFASTLRGILPALSNRKEGWRFSPDAIDAYLAHRTIPAPMTLVDGVRRLPNGHAAEFDLLSGKLEVRATPLSGTHPGNWLQKLDEAVVLRTIADRPVGLFLSGGIDSALIAARLVKCGQPLQAFTAAFPGSDMDESPMAAEVARRLGLTHHIVPVPESIRYDFAAIVAALDEPFADPSAIPLWYLAREASRQVKVVISGDGGDELFAGYKRYRKHLRSAWRRGLRFGSQHWPANSSPRGLPKWRMELAMDWREAYSLRFSGFSPAQRTFLQPAEVALPATYWRMPADDKSVSPLESLLAIDMLNYLPEYILRKADLATMAHGLELRSPMLDVQFYAAVQGMPVQERFTMPPKQTLFGALPDDVAHVLQRGKKRGFNPPLRSWLRTDLRDRSEAMASRLTQLSAGRLGAEGVEQYVAAYYNGEESLAEGMLQLLMLDESLAQIAAFPGWRA